MSDLYDTVSSSSSSFSMDAELLAEQRREILDAKTLNSDLDYAFNLQLQEAITASLSSGASSSRASPPPPSPTSGASFSRASPPPPSPTTAAISFGASYSRASPPSPSTTVSLSFGASPSRASPPPPSPVLDVTDLLLQDIERLEQEQRDRETGESLKREIISGLDRCLHDQAFAREITAIPESEWEEYGDYYQRPYEENSIITHEKENNKNLPGLVEIEEFRVYCKGVESEERVRGERVVVGGVGVAICDSRDNVRFEVRKRGLGGGWGIVGGGEEDKGKGLGVEVGVEVGVEAIVEGLGAALGLEMKRVALFCDDPLVFDYVTGNLQPKQDRIRALVEEVSRLQRRFTSCRPLLVSRNDLMFAFKLARDAIVSQITWTVETGNGEKNLKETCAICYEDTDFARMFSVDGCFHRYCFSCMKQHVETKLLNSLEAKCPHDGCSSQVSIHACGKFLDPKLVRIMIDRKNEALIAVTERVYCPYQKCSALMSKTEVLEYTRSSFVGADRCGARKCMSCERFFCVNCKVPWHYDMSCEDYKRSNPHPSREDAMLNSLARRQHWRQCVKCSQMVELAFGCYHITCRCGYEFCYTCGAEWKNKVATCKCPIWDERNIIHGGRRW